MPPCRLRLLLPVAERLEAELKHPLRFPLLSRDEPNDILVQPFLYDFSMYIGSESKFVFLFSYLFYKLVTHYSFCSTSISVKVSMISPT